MEEVLIECSPGVSGDMLLGAFFDLGVPRAVIEKPLIDIGLEKLYHLNFSESKSCSIRGVKVDVEKDDKNIKRNWEGIKQLITKSNLEKKLKETIHRVFESLAIAEAMVQGINPEDVHFHEIGAIDSIVDIVGVCAAINYLKPARVYCNQPNLGKGFVQTEHGKLSVPSPAVIELLSKTNIKVSASFDSIEAELSTPTGIALIANIVDSYQLPRSYSIKSYGVGLGSLQFQFPNLVRVLKIKSDIGNYLNQKPNPRYEEISVQEAWIDDQTSEDIASFIQKLRNEGAYDVSYQVINMKKDRVGYSVQVILPLEKREYFRRLWFHYSNTLGVRERVQSRWVLLRRGGECSTDFGKIKAKQTLKPDGSMYLKPENNEIIRISLEHDKKTEDVRNIIKDSISNFEPYENWK